MKYFFILVLLGFSITQQARAQIDLGSDLTEEQLDGVGKYLAGFSLFSRLRGSGWNGKGFHLEFGGQTLWAKLDPLREALGAPNNANIQGSVIGVPRSVFRLFYSFFELGIGFIPTVTIQDTKISTLNGEFTFFLGDYLNLPFKVDIRGHASEVVISYDTTLESIFTIPVTVKTKFSTLGLAMGVSYPLGPRAFTIQPYGSVGIVQSTADYGSAATIVGLISDTTLSNKYTKTAFHGTVGLAFTHFDRVTWAFELDRLGKLYYLGFGLSVRLK